MPKRRAVLCALLLAGCGGSGPRQSFAGLVRVSGQSPFPPGCEGAGQVGTNFRNAEVEPFVAVDPGNAKHLVGVWQQDRWSNGGSNGLASAASFDGGNTWTRGFAHFSLCSGGNAANRADFQRASDPWITFAPDGTPHQIGYGFDNVDARSAMMAVRSHDGGRTWTEPIFLFEESDPDAAIDKETITADPGDAQMVYAVWDRLTGVQTPTSPTGTGPAWFTRTTDGGATWETARIIYDPGTNAQTLANQIVVLPGGTLVNLMTIVTQLNQPNSPARVSLVRSLDKGVTWSSRIDIAPVDALGITDPKGGLGVRSGDIVPEIAVDKDSGALYVAWEDASVTGGRSDGIALSKSIDGGLNWTAPVRVNGAPAQAFTPAIAVAQGKVAILYYDLRNDNPSDGSQLLAAAWLSVSSDGGATFHETAAGGPFDLRTAAQTRDGYFVGDYQGLVATGASFVPFFAMTNDGNPGNRSDIFARPAGSLAAAAVMLGNGVSLPRRVRPGPRRVF